MPFCFDITPYFCYNTIGSDLWLYRQEAKATVCNTVITGSTPVRASILKIR